MSAASGAWPSACTIKEVFRVLTGSLADLRTISCQTWIGTGEHIDHCIHCTAFQASSKLELKPTCQHSDLLACKLINFNDALNSQLNAERSASEAELLECCLDGVMQWLQLLLLAKHLQC